MALFENDSTTGYTADELGALNAEWESRSNGMDRDSDEYDAAASRFCDEVSRR